jgi:ABC-type nitrate/sulfonate/bicarbonate transport system substrate-binding protein
MVRITTAVSNSATVRIEALYTICPLVLASEIAAEKGFLAEEAAKSGAHLEHLWAVPARGIAHFTHEHDALFRDGGSIPAVWAKSRGVDTTLLGLTFINNGSAILVKSDSPIKRIEDLRGKRVGLPTKANRQRVDYARATAERAIIVALEQSGLGPGSIEHVDILSEGHTDFPGRPIHSTAELVETLNLDREEGADVQALLAGDVGAIYANSGNARALEQGGRVKTIFESIRNPDWTLGIANSPYTLTVSTKLAQAHPEVVLGYLTAVVRASRWINEHPSEAAKILVKSAPGYTRSRAELATTLATIDVLPNFSGKNVVALNLQKHFLLERGYIQNDVALESWIDDRFLNEAVKVAST